jgi:hypothetical protein
MFKLDQLSPAAKRRSVLIGGGVLLALSIYLLAFLLPDVIRTLPGAESMTLSRAAEVATGSNKYVTLTDGNFDCDSIRYIRGPSSSGTPRIVIRNTEIFLLSPDTQVATLVTFSGETTCAEARSGDLTGYLTRMSSGTQQELTNDVRLARYISAESYLELCAYCGLGNSAIGAGFGVAFFIIGIVLLVWGFRMPKSGPADDVNDDDEAAGDAGVVDDMDDTGSPAPA